MKTKVYKLAAELGVREDHILEWLRGQGYPHMRRADMVRAELVVAARSALGGRSRQASREGPSDKQRGNFSNGRDGARGSSRGSSTSRHHSTRTTQDVPAESLTTSFAELLGDHLQMDTQSDSHQQTSSSSVSPRSDQEKLKNPAPVTGTDRAIVDARVSMEREKFADREKVLLAELKAAEDEVSVLRKEVESSRNLVIENASLKDSADALKAELDTLRSRLGEVEHERETLDVTCTGLHERIQGLESVKSDFENLEEDHSSIVTDLEATQQREIAWRARALELERSSQNSGLEVALAQAGAATLRMKQNLLIGLLSSDRSAQELMKTLSKIELDAFASIIKQNTRKVCANTLCRKCVSRQRRIPILVDDEQQCEICRGQEEKRFFEAMVCEASRTGVRRMLIFGASTLLKDRLRSYAEGCHLDLRLVDPDEKVTAARADGRIDGCDCFVTWTPYVLEPNPYLEAAKRAQKLWIVVSSSENNFSAMARQVTYRLARHSLLVTD